MHKIIRVDGSLVISERRPGRTICSKKIEEFHAFISECRKGRFIKTAAGGVGRAAQVIKICFLHEKIKRWNEDIF
jgi:hypothetical protein